MITAGTGHREPTLGLSYSHEDRLFIADFATEILEKHKEVSKIITGMATGWDQALAIACIRLNKPFIAALPFSGQEASWPYDGQAYYCGILDKAEEVIVVCEGGYANWKYYERDKWMVDHSEMVLALYSGLRSGTKHTVDYAEKRDKNIINVWNDWKKWMVNKV